MDYEKAYREALERANMIYNDKYKPEIAAFVKKTLETIFPELDEDERIRKALLEGFKNYNMSFENFGGIDVNSIIAWLENHDKKIQQTPLWMITFLDENRGKFASSMDDYDEQREAEGKLLAIIDWLEK